MTNKTEALKLALEAFEADASNENFLVLKHCVREALADSALERMAENARELGLDYKPPCTTGSQCTSKCQQCEQPAQQQEPVAVARVDDLERGGRVRALAMGLGLDAALYTSPQPAQPSKPLTDEEIAKIAEKYTEPLLFRVKDFARAIEAAHGIKGSA